ncbi:MAG: fibronectin type III domain-containing protein [Bacteroidota bacterium]
MSEPSDHSDPFVASEPFTAPTDLKLVEITKRSMVVQWKAPQLDGGSSIASYIIEKRCAIDKLWVRCNYDVVANCEYEVDDLIHMAEYEFRVSARNKSGIVGPTSHVLGPLLFKAIPEAPKVVISGSDKLKIESGSTLNLEMLVTGTPRPTLAWTKDTSDDITDDVRASVSSGRATSTFALEKVNRDDTGSYKLTASNLSGDASAVVKVTVVDTPGAPEGPVKFSEITAKGCMMTWNPPKCDGGSDVLYYVVTKCDTSKLSWTVINEQSETTTFRVSKLVEGCEYVFRITAVNSTGMGPFLQSTPIVASHNFGVPDAPGRPEAIRTHFNSITIGWTPSANDGGSKIIGYHVERLKDKGQRWSRCNDEPINDVQYRVTNLIEGAFYEFRVFAVNAAGISKPSPLSKPIECRMEIKPPGPPCIVRLVDTSTSSATLEWEAPLNDNGSEVTGYVVEKKKFDRNDTAEWIRVTEQPIEDCTMIVSDLEANEVYELQVKAVNKAGVGEACECNDFIKTVDRNEEPEFVLEQDFKSVVTVFSGQTLCLSAGFQGRPTPTATWTRDGEHGICKSALISTSKQSTVLTLEDAKREDAGKYVLTVENIVGTKKLRFIVRVIDVSGPVGPILYKDIKSESVTLSWTEPEFDGCTELTGYMVEKCDVVKMQWSTVTSDCTRTFYRLNQLVEGKTYKFRVTPFNKYGAGVARETDETLKITNAPSAPLNLDVDEVSFGFLFSCKELK